MPFIGTLTLEFCDVDTEDASLDDVLAAARVTPRDVRDWFLTLSRPNEDYMDVTLNEDGTFHVQYGEGGKHWIADSPVGQELLESLLASFYEHDNQWKQRCNWKEPKKGGILGFL